MLLAWLPQIAVLMAAGEVNEMSSQIASQACHACHTERTPSLQQRVKCQSCHDRNEDKTQRKIEVHHPIAALKPSQTNAPLGMSLPMVYPHSRFGPDPGPMVQISAGVFIMGSDSRLEDESPQHQARTGGYRIDRYEVTNLQYQHFIAATQRRSPRHFRDRRLVAGFADHPVTFVSWFDAQAYCDWAGKRLPTEIEWERAARGDDARIYPWGNEFEWQSANTPARWLELKKAKGAVIGKILDGGTTPIGAFISGLSPYGLYDMSGNVWEWVADWYGPHPGNSKPSENYGQTYKVLKGGSWWDCSFYKCGISAPTFNRSFFSPRVRNSSFGFRCGQDDF